MIDRGKSSTNSDGLSAIDGLGAAYSMSTDLSLILAVIAIAISGDPIAGTWSIGGGYAGTLGLLGKPQGIVGTHNRYEGDASIVRVSGHHQRFRCVSLSDEDPNPLFLKFPTFYRSPVSSLSVLTFATGRRLSARWQRRLLRDAQVGASLQSSRRRRLHPRQGCCSGLLYHAVQRGEQPVSGHKMLLQLPIDATVHSSYSRSLLQHILDQKPR